MLYTRPYPNLLHQQEQVFVVKFTYEPMNNGMYAGHGLVSLRGSWLGWAIPSLGFQAHLAISWWLVYPEEFNMVQPNLNLSFYLLISTLSASVLCTWRMFHEDHSKTFHS